MGVKMASQTNVSKLKCVHCGTNISSSDYRCSNCLMLTRSGNFKNKQPFMIVVIVFLSVILLGVFISVGFSLQT